MERRYGYPPTVRKNPTGKPRRGPHERRHAGATHAPREALTGPGLQTIRTTPTDVVLQSLGNTQPAASGQGNVYLIGSLGSASGMGTPQIVSGASVTWNAADGG
jgi:hypothetical protein